MKEGPLVLGIRVHMFTGATARNSERIFLEPMHDSMVRLASSSYNDTPRAS